jgi:DNA gyrase subunit B
LENYLIEGGLSDAIFTLGNGTQVGGTDLRGLADRVRIVKGYLSGLGRRLPLKISEQMAIAGALRPNALSDHAAAIPLAQQVALRLNELESTLEKGWQGTVEEGQGFIFTRSLRGVTESHTVDSAMLKSAEARKLDEMAAQLKEFFGGTGTLTAKERSQSINGPVALLDAIMDAGRKGIAIQRYKGLGEMNPSQLWETTLDPNVRSLLQVRVNHVEDAEEVFSTLMGDVVEPRRDFIQTNALKVANLDV